MARVGLGEVRAETLRELTSNFIEVQSVQKYDCKLCIFRR